MTAGDIYDVAVVGFGPVGEVLANLLGRDGFRTLVVERDPTVYHLPRAAHFDGEIMRAFQAIGLADEVVGSTSLVSAYQFVTADGEVLLNFDGIDADDPSGWKADYFFYQPPLEAALRKGVERYPNVDVRLGTEVVGLRTDADDVVELDVRPAGSDDEPETVRARWVVGCDGGRSFVRKSLGVPLEDSGFEEDWLVIDLALTAPADDVAHLDQVAYQICDPARPVTQIPMPPPYRRWEFMLVEGETREDMEDPAKVAELLEPWLRPDQYEVVRGVVYTFHGLVATGWRHNRVLIAGDAAHQMPPFLGQGMCSGIRDALNLEWKLAMVLRGHADEAILDTYEPERRPHVKAITDMAVTMGSLICTTDPVLAAARDEGMLAADGQPPGADQRYPALGSGLFGKDEGEGVGGQLPQPQVVADGKERLLDDVLGGGWSIVSTSPLALPPEVAEWWQQIGGTIVEVGTDVMDDTGMIGNWLEKQGATAAIVRPDRYVYALTTTGDPTVDQTVHEPGTVLTELRVALDG